MTTVAAALFPFIVRTDHEDVEPLASNVDPAAIRFGTLADLSEGDVIVGAVSDMTYASAKAICTNPTVTAVGYAVWFSRTYDVIAPTTDADGYVTWSPRSHRQPSWMTVLYVPRDYR
jgi:hypothetical protein